jgi:hypothetical protein
MALGLRPARAANCSCVSPASARKRRSIAPNAADPVSDMATLHLLTIA